jgi:anti-sigma factor RsiW
LETFADGELAPGEIIEVETHLEQCERCSEQLRLVQAIKGSVRRVALEDAQVSGAFEARVRAALLSQEQAQRSQARRAGFSKRSMMGGFASACAAAAAMVFMVWGSRSGSWSASGPVQDMASTSVGLGSASLASAAVGMEETLDRLIDHHSAPQEPQVTEASLLPTFEPNIGVRIRLPRLDRYGAHWEGASLVPVTNHQAASLRYTMPGHRVTVYVFDPRKVAVRQPLERLERPVPETVDSDPVYVGQWRGYSVAAKERLGVGYALAGDLEDDQLLQLISSIH